MGEQGAAFKEEIDAMLKVCVNVPWYTTVVCYIRVQLT